MSLLHPTPTALEPAADGTQFARPAQLSDLATQRSAVGLALSLADRTLALP